MMQSVSAALRWLTKTEIRLLSKLTLQVEPGALPDPQNLQHNVFPGY